MIDRALAERERAIALWEKIRDLGDWDMTIAEIQSWGAVCANEALKRAENTIVYFFDTHQGQILNSDPVCHTLVGRIRALKAEG